jgi:hypothetical protein
MEAERNPLNGNIIVACLMARIIHVTLYVFNNGYETRDDRVTEYGLHCLYYTVITWVVAGNIIFSQGIQFLSQDLNLACTLLYTKISLRQVRL